MIYGQEGGYGSVPKKRRYGLFIGCVLFLVLVIGGFYCYKFMFAKNSIELLLDSAFEYLELAVENNDYNSVTGAFSFQMKFQSNDETENEVFDIFNKLDFSGNYGIDYDKNIMSLDVKSDYDDKDLLDIGVYTEYGRAYFSLDGLYDKYIDTAVDNYSKLFERDYDDVKNVIKGVKSAYEESIKDKYFIVEKVTVDGERLTKTTLDLTDENYQEWNRNFTQALLENDIYLDSYAKIADMEVHEVKKELEEALEEEKDYEGEQYILYTKMFDMVKFEMNNPDYRVVVKINDGNYEYELYEKGIEFANGNVEMNLADSKNVIAVSYYDIQEAMAVEVTVNILVEENGLVERKDVTNSISTDDISDEDIMTIYNKLMENEGLISIRDELLSIISWDDDGSSLPIVTS